MRNIKINHKITNKYEFNYNCNLQVVFSLNLIRP